MPIAGRWKRLQEKTVRQAYTAYEASRTPTRILGVTAQRLAPGRSSGPTKRRRRCSARDRLLPNIRDQIQAPSSAVIESRLVEAYLQLTQPDPTRVAAPNEAKPKAARRHARRRQLSRTCWSEPELDQDQARGPEKDEASRVAEVVLLQGPASPMRSGTTTTTRSSTGKLAISYNAERCPLLLSCSPTARFATRRLSWQRLAEQNYTRRRRELDPVECRLLDQSRPLLQEEGTGAAGPQASSRKR